MADLSGARVLVTGGAGFIGSHLVDMLLDEDVSSVIVYDNFVRGTRANLSLALRDPRVVIFPVGGDILSTDILEVAMRGIDVVFHLASLWTLHCNDYPRNAFETNVAGTFNVIEAAIKCQVEKTIFSSSASVYGNATAKAIDENHPLNNRTFYGATKIAGEQMFRASWERFGMDYIGLRYMNVYGNRQDYLGAYISVIMRIIDNIMEGVNPLIHGDGMETYDFVHVRDVARANILAAKSCQCDEFYNIGTGKGTTLKTLANSILDIMGSKLEVEYVQREDGGVNNRVGVVKKAESDLGFTAKTSLESGLMELVQWRKDNDALIQETRGGWGMEYLDKA